MNPKIIIIAIAAVILLVAGAFFGGVMPGISIMDDGWDTVHTTYAGCTGNPGVELLDQKGYIVSYKDDGFSEKIVATGSVEHGDWSAAHAQYFRYTVYLKENAWSQYEKMSAEKTSMYLTNPNPGSIPTVNWDKGGGSGHIHQVAPYNFRIVGDKYNDGCIKVTLEISVDYNFFNPFDNGYEWKVVSSDEALLYSGYGGLYLPMGIEDGVDRPYDTFEIGQEVDIRVETAKGGYGSDTPWRVTLNEPYSGDINSLYTDDLYTGGSGGIVVEKFYMNDVTNGHFKFTVTADMAQKSMQSSDPYTVRIWNELLPKGSLYVDFLDFIALAPSEVTLEGVDQSKIGDTVTVQLTASVNPETQADIDYFRVSVIYGVYGVLLPSDPNSNKWIIHTVNIPASGNAATVSFIPTSESYVSVHAKAFDVEGRGSPRTEVWSIWIYALVEVPDEVIEDETGQHDYSGGHTDSWLPWDPEGGNWGQVDIEDYLPLIIAIAVFIIMLIIAFIPQIPIPFGMFGRMAVVVLGAVLAAVIYWYLGGTI